MNLPRQSLLKQVRKNCLDCCGDSAREVRFCSSTTSCALWFFRFGKTPKRVIRTGGPEAGMLFDPANFVPGAAFDPTKDVTEILDQDEGTQSGKGAT